MSFRIERNRAVQGLHIACNAITTEYEQSIFESSALFPYGDYLRENEVDAELAIPSRHGPTHHKSLN